MKQRGEKKARENRVKETVDLIMVTSTGVCIHTQNSGERKRQKT